MTSISSSQFLKLYPKFRKGPEELTSAILKHSRVVAVPPNTLMQMAGEYCSDLAFSLYGEKRVYQIGENGREITLYYTEPGEVCMLNVASILADKPCPAEAMSKTDVESLLLPCGVFRDLVSRYEDMSKFAFGVVNDSVVSVLDLVNEVVFRRVDERLRDYLIEKSEDGNINATHQRIANDLGTAREVISRLLKHLEQEGVVKLARSHICLLDPTLD